MPPFLLFLIRHAAIGFGISALFVGFVIWADPSGLGRLLLSSREHPLPVLLLWFFSGLTFGGVQMAIAIMLPEEEQRPRPPRGRMVPVPVRAQRRRD